jgi:serine/threonine protein kinase
MDTSTISAKDRQQLEELLDRFDRALREARSGALPDIEEHLGSYQGKARQYLRREMEALVSDLVRGEYVKLRRIGGGGMGDVFLVRHTILGREFALKEIKLEALQQGDRDEFSGRFQREIAVFGQLEYHPNIVSATNTGTTEQGVVYLVMEFIDGEDLKQIVERHGPLEVNQACKIIHDAAVGLAYIHEKVHVHREI